MRFLYKLIAVVVLVPILLYVLFPNMDADSFQSLSGMVFMILIVLTAFLDQKSKKIKTPNQ